MFLPLRVRGWRIALALAAPALACGGSTATIPGSDADGSAGDDGSSGAEGGVGRRDGGGHGDDGAAGATCAQLSAQIDQLRLAARKCCVACNHLPCQYLVDDLCCVITVDATSSQDVIDFENAVQAFRVAKCEVLCPAIVCNRMPSQMCDPQTALCAL
jgi:hypothetical protein